MREDLPTDPIREFTGYTSKTPGTEDGIAEPTPTFSTCFGVRTVSFPDDINLRASADPYSARGKFRLRSLSSTRLVTLRCSPRR